MIKLNCLPFLWIQRYSSRILYFLCKQQLSSRTIQRGYFHSAFTVVCPVDQIAFPFHSKTVNYTEVVCDDIFCFSSFKVHPCDDMSVNVAPVDGFLLNVYIESYCSTEV